MFFSLVILDVDGDLKKILSTINSLSDEDISLITIFVISNKIPSLNEEISYRFKKIKILKELDDIKYIASKCIGEYIIFLGSGDLLCSDAVYSLIDICKKHVDLIKVQNTIYIDDGIEYKRFLSQNKESLLHEQMLYVDHLNKEYVRDLLGDCANYRLIMKRDILQKADLSFFSYSSNILLFFICLLVSVCFVTSSFLITEQNLFKETVSNEVINFESRCNLVDPLKTLYSFINKQVCSNISVDSSLLLFCASIELFLKYFVLSIRNENEIDTKISLLKCIKDKLSPLYGNNGFDVSSFGGGYCFFLLCDFRMFIPFLKYYIEFSNRDFMLIKNKFDSFDKYVIYGAGGDGKNLLLFLRFKNLKKKIFFCDKNESIVSSFISGCKVLSVSSVADDHSFLIIIPNDSPYKFEMYTNLIKLGVASSRIIYGFETKKLRYYPLF